VIAGASDEEDKMVEEEAEEKGGVGDGDEVDPGEEATTQEDA
jgi:hypothetical protein